MILGGTGMVDEVARMLIGEGWRVVLPSRRPNPIARAGGRPALRASRPRGHRPNGKPGGSGDAIWVEAQWERPRELARRAEHALGGPAELLVAWVHESYRRSVLGAVERLLTAEAPIVEVRDGIGIGTSDQADPLLVEHPTQQVFLGSRSGWDGARVLTHAEITEGVLDAVRRALEGRPTSVHQIGQPRPLVR